MTSSDLSATLAPRFKQRLDAEPSPNAMQAGGLLVDELRKLLQEISMPPKSAVIDAVGRIYDQYIKPIDIPFVPNLGVEPMVDSAMRAALIALTDRTYDRLAEQV